MRLATLLLSCLLSCAALAQPVLRVDLRDRPPEMWSVDGRPAGPLVTVLETAAERIGARLEWRFAPFARSLADLREGRIDLVPRVLAGEGREDFVHFLPSIGSQPRDVLFLVRPGFERTLRGYDDLLDLHIGVKRGTAYFPRFDADARLHREAARDDDVLAQMFRAGRLHAIAVLDRAALEAAFARIGFSAYAYAEYREPILIDNRFGASRRLYEHGRAELYERLGTELAAMRERGEVAQIYRASGVEPPQP